MSFFIAAAGEVKNNAKALSGTLNMGGQMPRSHQAPPGSTLASATPAGSKGINLVWNTPNGGTMRKTVSLPSAAVNLLVSNVSVDGNKIKVDLLNSNSERVVMTKEWDTVQTPPEK